MELDNKSIAAHGSLAMLYLGWGDTPAMRQSIREVNELTPMDAEDYLFKGFADYYVDPDESIRLMKRGIELHDSGLARRLYSLPLIEKAVRTDDAALLEEGLQQVRSAHALLGDNRFGPPTPFLEITAS